LFSCAFFRLFRRVQQVMSILPDFKMLVASKRVIASLEEAIDSLPPDEERIFGVMRDAWNVILDLRGAVMAAVIERESRTLPRLRLRHPPT
jgi:hypothetical protein